MIGFSGFTIPRGYVVEFQAITFDHKPGRKTFYLGATCTVRFAYGGAPGGFGLTVEKRFPIQTKSGYQRETGTILGALAFIAGEAWYKLHALDGFMIAAGRD